MKQPWHKKALSHLFEITIEGVESEYNDLLHVSLVRGRYQLSTANAIYSFDDLYDNFRIAFEQLKWNQFKGKKVLLLGLGLGSIPYIVENLFGQVLDYVAVEIDDTVVYLAKKYVLDDLKSPVTVYTADAAIFVQQDDREYDLICVDVFIDDQTPSALRTAEFINQVQSQLTTDGILMYNVLSRTSSDRKRAIKFREDVFMNCCPGGGYIEAPGNWILVNDASRFNKVVV